MKHAIVYIDGSEGEGGGQMLRSSLSLSMVTGIPFKMSHIRAGRKNPGLMRQHLTCVRAAAKVSGAKVTGAEMGSKELTFIPGKPKGGDYHFAIGTAGSTTLVAQTVLPALMLADEPSTLTFEGGTHNMLSPPFDFLLHSFLPVLQKMGVKVEAQLHKHGFYPAGGGKISLAVTPAKTLQPLELMERGALKSPVAEAWFANLSVDIAKRELAAVGKLMQWPEETLHLRQIKDSVSTGNVILLKLEHEALTETVCAFGRLGVTAEKVAEEACHEAGIYLAGSATVGTHLADQLLLPMALAGAGRFTTLAPTPHTRTNIDVIQKFIPCSITVEEREDQSWLIVVNG